MVVIPRVFFSVAESPFRNPMFIIDGLFVSLRELSACNTRPTSFQWRPIRHGERIPSNRVQPSMKEAWASKSKPIAKTHSTRAPKRVGRKQHCERKTLQEKEKETHGGVLVESIEKSYSSKKQLS